MSTHASVNVAVIGAGPNGLSIAAYLAEMSVNFCIFGKPMDTWRNCMPRGMLLKSDGFASSIASPANHSSLAEYCARQRIPYDDLSIPVALETFVEYGLDFQRRFVPSLDERCVAGIRASDHGFHIRLDDGEIVEARRVVIAVGIAHFDYTPKILETLPTELASHSKQQRELERFKARSVTIVGAGASAVDLASLLHQAGAEVSLVTRSPAIHFGAVPASGGRSLWQRIRHPQSGLGPGLRSRLACDYPDLFRFLPPSFRMEIVRRHLGPASAWYHRERILGKVRTLMGCDVVAADCFNGRIQLKLRATKGESTIVETDYLIAATGYRVDIERLHFIDRKLRSQIKRLGGMPQLSSTFESSVPGLYFAGLAAAGSFGPLMRFVYGCRFTARRVTQHIVRS